MKIRVCDTPMDLGKAAANQVAELLNEAIEARGEARLVLSTGASQFETLQALVKENIPWDRVVVFHLDEYLGIGADHQASFRRYIQERFLNQVQVKQAVLIDPTSSTVRTVLQSLTNAIRKAPIDVGLIGVGENAHVAFNDPPADFLTTDAYHVVTLNDACKRQQVGEGWFASWAEVPDQAISMTVHQIMKCRAIVSAVPHAVKAQAVHDMLTRDVTPDVPATILTTHPAMYLFLDRDSAAKVPASLV